MFSDLESLYSESKVIRYEENGHWLSGFSGWLLAYGTVGRYGKAQVSG